MRPRKVEIRISGRFMRRTSFSSGSAIDLRVADITQLGCEQVIKMPFHVRAMTKLMDMNDT